MVAATSWWPVLSWLIIIICVLLMLVILIQKGRGAGLAGAFGGGGGGGGAFGTKTGDVFTWITVGLAAVFVLITVMANYAFYIENPDRVRDQRAVTSPAEAPAGAARLIDDVGSFSLDDLEPVQPEEAPPAEPEAEDPGTAGGEGSPSEPTSDDPAGSDEPADEPAGDD